MPATQSCTPCCSTPQVVNIPGPQGADGAAGAAGAAGTNGVNGFSTTTADFVLPAVNANVTANVDNSTWMAVGQAVVADGPATFQVVSKPTTTSVILKFLGYSLDLLTGTTISFPARIAPGGTSASTTALVTAQTGGPNLTGSNVSTSLLYAPMRVILHPNYFVIGKMLNIKVAGQLGNIVTTPGTLTIDVRLGGVIVFNGGAMQLSTTAHTALPFWLDIMLNCLSVGAGAAATLIGQGVMTSQCLSLTAVADSTTTPATLLLPNTTPAAGTGFDSTIANTLDLFATFSLANANAIQMQQYCVIPLN